MSAGCLGSHPCIWIQLLGQINKNRDLTFGTHARLEDIYKVYAVEKAKAIH